MGYIYANYPRHLIRHQFYLTDEQFDGAISYIDIHYARTFTFLDC